MFSCIELFNASYFLNILLNIGLTLRTIANKTTPNIGITAIKINDNFTLIKKLIIKQNKIIRGVLIAILIII